MSFDLVNVGIADMGVAESPNTLRTILGSCVGICIYDPKAKIGGLSHIMLPSSKKPSNNLKKYADFVLENNDTKEQLYEQIDNMMQQINKNPKK